MANGEVTITGLDDLERKLKTLPEGIKRGGVILRALRYGSKVIQKEARLLAPVRKEHEQAVTRSGAIKSTFRKSFKEQGIRPGALRAGIVDMFSKQQELTTIVRVRSRGYIFNNKSKDKKPNNPNYWWLLEFGTSRIPAVRFLRRAFEARKNEAATAIREGLQQEIAKANANPDAYLKSQQSRRRR